MKKKSSYKMLKCFTSAAAALLFPACGVDSDDPPILIPADASVLGESDSGGTSFTDASTVLTDADAQDDQDDGGNGCIMFGENAGTCPDAGLSVSDGGESPEDASAPIQDAGEQEIWDYCRTGYNPPVETAKLQESALTGVSGIIASRKNPGILWIHNDYKGTVQISAVDAATGITVAILKTPEDVYVANVEDVALARCPWADDENLSSAAQKSPQPVYADSPCLWLADSGNNLKTRNDLSVIIVPEPDLTAYSASDADQPIQLTADHFWKIPFSYPEDNCDSEAFVVDPDGNSFVLLEKVDEKSARVFSAFGPFTNGRPVLLKTEGIMDSHPFPLVTPVYGLMMTGADLHPNRQRFLLRTYIGTFEYEFQTSDWIHELLNAEVFYTAWGPLSEGQGEAIAYSADGKAFWTVSEDKDQLPGQGIHFYTCKN